MRVDQRARITARSTGRWIVLPIMALALAGCEEGAGGLTTLFGGNGEKTTEAAQAGQQSVKLIERDVEAPEVFQVTEEGLWDGRPSLGGVWVAHPDVKSPERVIIRKPSDGKFVIGALFRRERANPGPRLQVSSDAAAALGMLAGQPAELNVTALRREEVAEEQAEAAPDANMDSAAPDGVEQTTLAPAAVDAEASAEAETEQAAASSPAPKPQTSSLNKPFIQIGIFSVEDNARRTAERMRSAGMIPTVKKQSASGKPFWRVIVGPAATSKERRALLEAIRKEGFGDAYAVTN
ncbi:MULTISPECIES: SPOR domain-containing protein [Sediminimonas]|uniref:SPOR domain-containing protein n=1 Tax=Sediminimonas TaxID=659427 RepID=UPI000684C46C|nr:MULTISPECIES: SPOR domain-containing protein [Sediminimonas]MDR9486036.1 SPOR domain-containing protein [Sediminimonas sp.]